MDLTVANAVKRVFESVNPTFSGISVYRSVDKLYLITLSFIETELQQKEKITRWGIVI